MLRNDKPKGKTLWSIIKVVLIILSAVVIAAVAIVCYAIHQIKNTEGVINPVLRDGIVSLTESSEAMQLARELKADYRLLAQALRELDVQQATITRNKTDADISALERYFEGPLWRAAENISAIEEKMASAREILDLAKTANSALIDPLIQQLTNYPLTDMQTEAGFRVDIVIAYLDFIESYYPVANEFAERLSTIDTRFLNMVDSDGKIAEYSVQLKQLIDDSEPYLSYVPFLRAFLGNGGDRLYVFAAQNTAEIRASGGFPGSVGAIRIQNGLASIVEFQSVYNVFPSYVPYEAAITSTEANLFNGRMSLPWDADFSPDFERVANIWALAYQNRNGEHVDGVISATPVVIQRLLSLLGEVSLSDGTVIDGNNAMRVLQHDLYYKYLSRVSEVSYRTGNDLTDQLFAETAKKTLNLLFSSLDFEHLRDVYFFTQQSFADRTLLLWMADEDEQELIRQMGWAGTLNKDETKPEIGVFFNSTSASKMGWYLDIDVTIGEATENEDGSMTYPISVCYSNRITQEERDIAGGYILGGGYGGLIGGMYIFAPAGGSISNFRSSKGYLYTGTYQGLDLIYQYSNIEMGSSIEIECEITTAPVECSQLTVMQTPTAQGYR